MQSYVSSEVLIGDISVLSAAFHAVEAQPGPPPQASMTVQVSVADVQLADEMICVGIETHLHVLLQQEGSEHPCFESDVHVGCTAASSGIAPGNEGAASADWGLEQVLACHAAEASVGFLRGYVCEQCMRSSLHQPLLIPPIDVAALLRDNGAFASSDGPATV